MFTRARSDELHLVVNEQGLLLCRKARTSTSSMKSGPRMKDKDAAYYEELDKLYMY